MGSKEAADTAQTLYSQGNEAFVNEDYSGAVELYTSALALHQHFADALVARAHALIKTDKYPDAKKDADKAIDILRAAGGETTPLISKAFLRSGVASFHLGRYRDAKNCFEEGQKVGGEAGLKQWMSWCDDKIAKFGDLAPGVKAAPVKQNKTDDVKGGGETKTSPAAAGAVESEEAVAVSVSAPSNSEMPVPKVREYVVRLIS